MYYLIQRQSGGCDYTIGCGIKVTQLRAISKAEAMKEAAEEIGSSWQGQDEKSIDSAELLEVSEATNLEEFLNQKKAERKARIQARAKEKQRVKDQKEFERLRVKLGQ